MFQDSRLPGPSIRMIYFGYEYRVDWRYVIFSPVVHGGCTGLETTAKAFIEFKYKFDDENDGTAKAS
jgi:hypothetical protein